MVREVILGQTTKASAQAAPQLMTQRPAGQRWIHYCAGLDEATMRIDSNGLEIPVGCQQRLAERDSRFLFSLRMRLLLLLSALFLMVQASLTFYLPSIEPASASSCGPQPNSSPHGDLGESADNVAANQRRQLPPDYWRALRPADVVLVVDKPRSGPPKQLEMHCLSTEPDKLEPRPVVAVNQ